MAQDKDDGTAAIYREPMPPRKSCTSYHVFKILSIIYAIIFFVSASVVFLSLTFPVSLLCVNGTAVVCVPYVSTNRS